MAKKNEHIDVIFREKLENHEVKPSQLAWERLEHQLPKEEKSSTRIYWWAAAAAVLVIFLVGSLLRNPSQPFEEEQLTAEKVETAENQPSQAPEVVEDLVADNTPIETEENSTPIIEKPKQEITNQKPQSTPEIKNQFEEPSKNLIAEAQIPEKEEIEEEKINQAEIAPITLPIEREIPELKPMDLNQAVAELKTEEPQEPTYKVTIISDGIKDDKNLIAGIGKKVDQVGGILGKVDEGFANLQDAKNNLFASLTTRKEKMTEE
ncbi:hypothetical protein E4S40_10535 [Algoriphagus kandeliae]|uniref:Uncharacterized protein n=1 Tax=Algoriphagus kandeliae TaxID=2562278 RepID=A0A4Y9QP93_9BACT|nr:hypothetical protein [Algoriphagus kandeliae]TFV94451.1 hypothetical protein E4S40_10535 [Algoriphagus kandeliae]